MKECSYCGRLNDDSAAACGGCGGVEFKSESSTAGEPEPRAGRPRFTALNWRDWLANPVALYRTLIVISFGALVLWFLLPSVDGYFLSDETNYILGAQGYGAILPIPVRISWMVFFINLAVAPGLWFFCLSARWVYVSIIIFFVAVKPLAGVQVETSLSSFIGYIMTLADGALLILSFTSPIRQKFEEPEARGAEE